MMSHPSNRCNSQGKYDSDDLEVGGFQGSNTSPAWLCWDPHSNQCFPGQERLDHSCHMSILSDCVIGHLHWPKILAGWRFFFP